MRVLTVSLGCLLVLVFAVTQVQAELVTPESAVATNSFGFNPPSLLIDGSGLDGTGPVKDQLHDNVEANNWQTDAFTPPPSSDVDLIFTFDGNYDLSAGYIWNFNNLAGADTPDPVIVNWRGIKEFNLLVSSVLGDPLLPFDDPGNFTFVDNFTLDKANETSESSSDPEPAQTRSFVANNVRRVKFEVIKNFSEDAEPPFVDEVIGLSEVRFEGVLIPEPATMGLAIGALSISLGLMRRRRNRT